MYALCQGENYKLERVLMHVDTIGHGPQTMWAPQSVSLGVSELRYSYPGRESAEDTQTIDFFGLRDIGMRMTALQDWAMEEPECLYKWSLSLYEDEEIIVCGIDASGDWAEGYRAGHRAQRGVFPRAMVHDDPFGHKSRTGGVGNALDCLELWDEHGVIVQFRLPKEHDGGGKGNVLRPTIWEWIFCLNALGERVRRREAHVHQLALDEAEAGLKAALSRQEHAAATKIQDAMMLQWQRKKKGLTRDANASESIQLLGPSQRATVELRRAVRNSKESDPPGILQSAIARTVARRPNPRLLIEADEILTRQRKRSRAIVAAREVRADIIGHARINM